MKANHSLSEKETYLVYETQNSGLSSKEAEQRLLKNGKNATVCKDGPVFYGDEVVW